MSQDNQMLAVGFITGVVSIYNADTLERNDKLTYSKIKNPDQEVLNIVRFHSKGKFLAVSYSCPKPKLIFFGLNSPMKILG